jgi:hypothetical protein
MARRHRPACEHRRSGAGAVAPQPALDLPPALIAELDALAESGKPIHWSRPEDAVLIHYWRKNPNTASIITILEKAFPGLRNYSIDAVQQRLRRLKSQGRF